MPNNMNLQITNNPSYIFYIDKNRVADLEGKFVGKWMYFFNNSHVAFAESICKKAVQSGAVIEAKHTSQESIDFLGLPTGVCCLMLIEKRLRLLVGELLMRDLPEEAKAAAGN